MSNGTTSIEATGGQFLQFVNVLWKVVKRMDATTLEGWLKNQDGLLSALSEALIPPSIPTPKIGDTITIPPTHFHSGGAARVHSVGEGVSGGRKVPFVSVEEVPNYLFNWEFISKLQK